MKTVKDLKEALEGVPDDMKLVVECHGNQHRVYSCGIAQLMDDGMFEIPGEGESFNENREKNFLIDG